MRFWRIDSADVVLTLEQPDTVVPSEKGRLNAVRKLDQGFLRVTYKEELDHLLVVTVTPRRKP
jgi:hypothetical protein